VPPGVQLPSTGLGRWGHLVLLRKIGEGAFGEVYHAHDTWLDHPVALKLFKPKVASRSTANRILHEARKLARIRHPNVVSVHGADSHNGQLGFWMDLIEGATLEKIVLGGRLSAGEATYIGQEVCRALAAVHQAEIVHRDVKAQNVMRASDGGRIILMDFGAGEFIKEASAGSRGQGTPLYLAPEIFAGKDASVQSDIYAVGVLLYYLVTGGFPVQASSVGNLVDAHKRGERRRLRDGRPDLPSSFVSIVERATDADPGRRFASAGEMEAALNGGTISDVGPINFERFRGKHEERSTFQIGVLAVQLVAVAVITTEVLGLIACRIFDVVFGIEREFAAGPIDYFSVGIRSLLPFVIFWLAWAAILGGLAGLRTLFRSPLAAIRRRWAPMIRSVDADTLATVVFLGGAGCWLAISWAYADIFYALEALRHSAANPSDLAVLSSRAIPLHTAHGVYSSILTFVLGLAIWQWFPRLEKLAEDASRVLLLKWATVALAFMVIVSVTVARRFVWERYEVVAFEDQRAFVIADSPEELLLYSPRVEDPKRWRVRKDAATLRRTGTTARIFDP
jgi:serine/threonine-protein kinase